MTDRHAAAARAAQAVLDGEDPLPHLAGIDAALLEQTLALVKAATEMPCWHAERIAALATVQARRAAVEQLPAKLQPAVKRRLTALWKAQAGL